MKIYITIMLLCISAACSKQHKQDTTAPCIIVSTIVDTSDVHILHPQAQPILSLYDFAHDKSKEAIFRWQTISDMQLGPVGEYHLASEEGTDMLHASAVPYLRKQLIQTFYDSVTHAVTQLQTVPVTGSSHTECFACLAAECRYINEHENAKGIILLFSNLKENTYVFSCFRNEDAALLKTNPDRVASRLLKEYPLPASLEGVTVYVIYQPANREDEQTFLLMQQLYTHILESRHARVLVQANNTVFDNK